MCSTPHVKPRLHSFNLDDLQNSDPRVSQLLSMGFAAESVARCITVAPDDAEVTQLVDIIMSGELDNISESANLELEVSTHVSDPSNHHSDYFVEVVAMKKIEQALQSENEKIRKCCNWDRGLLPWFQACCDSSNTPKQLSSFQLKKELDRLQPPPTPAGVEVTPPARVAFVDGIPAVLRRGQTYSEKRVADDRKRRTQYVSTATEQRGPETNTGTCASSAYLGRRLFGNDLYETS